MVVRALFLLLLVCSCACARRAMPRAYDGGLETGEPEPLLDAGPLDALPDAHVPDAAAAEPDAGPANPVDASVGLDAAQQDAATQSTLIASEVVGGSAGGAFDDRDLMPVAPELQTVTLRSGDRLDAIQFKLRNGTLLVHGGTGGSEHVLELALGEAVTYARLCTGEHDGTVRLFYARLGTNLGHEVAGGNETDACTNFMAPDGYQISGMHGRSGYEVDALGFLYTRLVAP